MAFNERSEKIRKRMLKPLNFRAYITAKVPLAAFAGLRLESLDETQCTVALPGGWRTQNPFQSTYFAAQAMAAEMSTGAPAMVLLQGAPASVAMLVREVRAVYTKKIQGVSRFTFAEVEAMRATIERAAGSDDSHSFVARSTGRTGAGEVASEFEITWSFKRRQARAAKAS